jgi:hypothetical protein
MLMGQTPPDAQPMTLQDHLEAALQIMAQDRQFTPDEQQAVAAFMQGVQMLAQGQGAAGFGPAGQQNPFQQMNGPQGQQQGQMVPYGMTQGAVPKPGFMQPDYTGDTT